MDVRPFSHSLRTIAIILFVLALPFLLFGWWLEPQLEEFLTSGWPAEHAFQGAVVAIGLLVSDLLLPIPNSVVCTVTGSIWGPVWGTMIGWTGLTLASVAGYWLGRKGISKLVSANNESESADNPGRNHSWILVACRPLPLLAEASVVAAGLYRMPIGRFLPPVLISNFALALAWSLLGHFAIENGWMGLGMVAGALVPVLAAFAWIGWITGNSATSGV